MITKTHQMTARQLNQLKQLMAVCKRVDGSSPNVYTHLLSQKRALPASHLYMNKQQQLIAFASAYFFYDDACEVALMVLPVSRQKGIAKKLIAELIPLVTQHGMSRMIFSSPGKRGTEWFNANGFTYMHTEYNMIRSYLKKIDVSQFAALDIRKATESMIPALCELDEECFPKEHTDNPTHFMSLLHNEAEYQLFALYVEDRIVGKAHLRWSGKSVTFSDIAITTSMQGKGLGSALIAHCVNYALDQGKTRLILDVEAKNERALKIYTNFGFEVQNTADYWSIFIEKLQETLRLPQPDI